MSTVQILPAVSDYLKKTHGQLINGESYANASNTTIDVINPATEAVIAHVYSASDEEVDQAVSAARHCFDTKWKSTLPYQRAQLMNKFADLIETNGEEIAQLETLCSGKQINASRMFEIQQAASFLRYYAGWATKISGETLTPSFPSMAGEQYTAFTRREPIGVVAGIIPWNFPVMIAIWKLGAALAVGCTVVLKPSEFTPLSLLRVVELAKEAGFPDGTINLVQGRGDVGEKLIRHPHVAKVSFTGSVPTGLKVGKTAMESNLTRCTLELGGKNAAALLDDADIDKAVMGLFMTGYIHQGQVCAAPERIYVPRSRLEELTTKLAAQLDKAGIGSPLDDSLMFGPISNGPQYQKVCRFLETAASESRILHGGHPLPGDGYFVEPTIVEAASNSETLMQAETFGPIITFMPYDDESELVELMNDTPFGLSASLWTNDLSRAMRLVPQIEAGTVWVNMHTLVDPSVPFGGAKCSGIGREFGSAFIDDYTNLKSVMLCY